MPTSRRREDQIIELFVSAYEDGEWKDSHVYWLDHVTDGAVEALVTRPDGNTLAIEHTLIESFVGEREDLERSKIFQDIEGDPALRQVDRIVYIDVPRGALPKGTPWNAIVTCVQRWLQANLAQLREGEGFHDCRIAGSGIGAPFTMRLHIKVINSKGSVGGPLIRRWGPTNVDATVKKALTAKLPKLAKTLAAVRILLLERNQFSLSEARIWQEIRRRTADFPLLVKIAAIWFAETVFYDVSADPHWRGYLGLNQYAGDQARLMATMYFKDGVLISRSRDGIADVTPENGPVLGGSRP